MRTPTVYTPEEVKSFKEAADQYIIHHILVRYSKEERRRYSNWKKTKAGMDHMALTREIQRKVQQHAKMMKSIKSSEPSTPPSTPPLQSSPQPKIPKTPKKESRKTARQLTSKLSPRRKPSRRTTTALPIPRQTRSNGSVSVVLSVRRKKQSEQSKSSMSLKQTNQARQTKQAKQAPSHIIRSARRQKQENQEKQPYTPPTEYYTEDFPIAINIKDLTFLDRPALGEGQIGKVSLAKYANSILVACKARQDNRSREAFKYSVARELSFAAKLSACRFINQYVGLVRCNRHQIRVMSEQPDGTRTVKSVARGSANSEDIYVVQRYYENGDLRDHVAAQQGKLFTLSQILQIGISLFAAITDMHLLNIGMVDLKLENVLVDLTGSGWLTDFGSCVEMRGAERIDLNHALVSWTMDVAAPEMIQHKLFYKASDVFMATLVIAEMMTPQLSDAEFQQQVLVRHKDGTVHLNEARIPKLYDDIRPLLQKGLDNDPMLRPPAQWMLDFLLNVRREL